MFEQNVSDKRLNIRVANHVEVSSEKEYEDNKLLSNHVTNVDIDNCNHLSSDADDQVLLAMNTSLTNHSNENKLNAKSVIFHHSTLQYDSEQMIKKQTKNLPDLDRNQSSQRKNESRTFNFKRNNKCKDSQAKISSYFSPTVNFNDRGSLNNLDKCPENNSQSAECSSLSKFSHKFNEKYGNKSTNDFIKSHENGLFGNKTKVNIRYSEDSSSYPAMKKLKGSSITITKLK